MIKNTAFIIGILGLFTCISAVNVFAEEEDVVVTVKSITGEVSGISSKFIAVVYERNSEKGVEYEMPFSLRGNVEMANRKFGEISSGDTVKIQYEETIQEFDVVKEDGTMEHVTKVISRAAKVITFISPADKGLRSKK